MCVCVCVCVCEPVGRARSASPRKQRGQTSALKALGTDHPTQQSQAAHESLLDTPWEGDEECEEVCMPHSLFCGTLSLTLALTLTLTLTVTLGMTTVSKSISSRELCRGIYETSVFRSCVHALPRLCRRPPCLYHMESACACMK